MLDHTVRDSLLAPKGEVEEPVVGVSLRTNDPLAKKISSVGVDTRNILVKVTLPKRTGRKRKRGSNEPFEEPLWEEGESNSVTALDLLARMRDNKDSYSIEPIGMINETHRFRNPPDFQLRTGDVPIMREIKKHALTPSYDTLKDFYIDPTPGPQGITAFPAPPQFVTTAQPFRYDYEQAPGLSFALNEQGQTIGLNAKPSLRRQTRAVAPDIPEVPQGPPEALGHTPFGVHLNGAIEELNNLLDERPLVTRRVAMNHIPHYSDTIFKEAIEWIGYSFKSGPWRDTLIKYGVDPRKDPKYRFYQTMMFQLDKKAAKIRGAQSSKWTRSKRHIPDDNWQSHIFDGKHVTLNGKTWQVCDVTDPLVHDILNTEDVPETCDVNLWGWYHNGTLAKARVIMRTKMDYLFAEKEPPHTLFQTLTKMPNRILENTWPYDYVSPQEDGELAARLAMDVRSMAKFSERMRERASGSRLKKKVEKKKKQKAGTANNELADALGAQVDGRAAKGAGEGDVGRGHRQSIEQTETPADAPGNDLDEQNEEENEGIEQVDENEEDDDDDRGDFDDIEDNSEAEEEEQGDPEENEVDAGAEIDAAAAD